MIVTESNPDVVDLIPDEDDTHGEEDGVDGLLQRLNNLRLLLLELLQNSWNHLKESELQSETTSRTQRGRPSCPLLTCPAYVPNFFLSPLASPARHLAAIDTSITLASFPTTCRTEAESPQTSLQHLYFKGQV